MDCSRKQARCDTGILTMRARNIKPGFFKNPELAECSIPARLLFIGLWCMADRNGYLENRPKQIKMELLPADALETAPLIDELVNVGLLRLFGDGDCYIWIPTFKNHQNPHFKEKPNKKIPKHTDDQLAENPGPAQGKPEADPGPAQGQPPLNVGSGILDQGSGILNKEKKRVVGFAATTPPAFEEIRAAWNAMAEAARLPTCRSLTKSRKAAIKSRISDPDWRDNWKQAMDAIPKRPFFLGQNKRQWQITFDFFLKPDTVTKILEGGYTNGKFTYSEEHEDDNAGILRLSLIHI